MVLKFLEGKDKPEGSDELGLHPLDIYRRSQLKGHLRPYQRDRGGVENTIPTANAANARLDGVVPRSAWKLCEAGIRFMPSKTAFLDDINLDNGRLYMPKFQLDDSTAYKFHNMMAFEAMHVSTENDVTAYALFVKDLVDSAQDVRLLVNKRILEHDLADDDDAVVKLFNGLTRDVYKNWESNLCRVREDV